jgi:YHS domain-containing protein
MMRNAIKSAFAGAFLIGLATAAFAATGEFDNMCAQGLTMEKSVKTDCSVNETYQGKTYCFGNEQAKTDFMKDPDASIAKAEAYYSKHSG